MFSFFDISSSLWQTFFISFLSLLNPWNLMEDETKKQIVENSVISSINILHHKLQNFTKEKMTI